MLTELHEPSVSSRRNWLEIAISLAMSCRQSYRRQQSRVINTLFLKKRDWYSQPQLHVKVLLGGQYTAAAKSVNGLNALISSFESGVIDWRFAKSELAESSLVTLVGAASTLRIVSRRTTKTGLRK
jgi:hypothetical protein